MFRFLNEAKLTRRIILRELEYALRLVFDIHIAKAWDSMAIIDAIK